jgi:hypothetical protein
MKYLEKIKPKTKFSGQSSSLNFARFMEKMELQIDKGGVSDDLRLDGIDDWFSGQLLDFVQSKNNNNKFIDALTTLRNIKTSLEAAFGSKDFNVDTMINQCVKGDVIAKGDFKTTQTFVIGLETKYDLAEGRGEAKTLKWYLRILTKKLFHMKGEWLKDCSGGDMSFQTYAKFVRETARRKEKRRGYSKGEYSEW